MNKPLRMNAETVGKEKELESPPSVAFLMVNIFTTLFGILTMTTSGALVWFAIDYNLTQALGLGNVDHMLNAGIMGFTCGLLTSCFATSKAVEISARWKADRQEEKDFIEKVLDEYHQRSRVHPRILKRIAQTENQRYKDM